MEICSIAGNEILLYPFFKITISFADAAFIVLHKFLLWLIAFFSIPLISINTKF